MSRPKGYAPWTPRPETQVVIAQVQEVIEQYRAYLPMTARQIFYRLVGQYDYEKTERAYKRLCETLVRARRAQLIGFNAIRDDGTVSHNGGGWDSPAQWWRGELSAAKAYRRDRMAGQDVRVEVWCEAAGMAPQLARVASHYSIGTYSTGGFSSVTVTREIAERALEFDGATAFLHLGDFDPSGQSIYEAMSEDAGTFVRQLRRGRGVPGAVLSPRRVALTRDQVELYDLPTAPPKSTDTRSVNWYDETCQLEAMPPDQINDLLKVAIENVIDLDLFHEILAEEEAERDALVAKVTAFVGDQGDE
jgi:hypothetical protein